MPYISRPQTEDLLNCFSKAIKSPKSHPLVFNVWGIGGVGKTTLLNRIAQQPEVNAARVYFGATPDIATPLKLMANLYRQLPTTSDWGEEYEAFPALYQKYEDTLAQLKQPDKKETDAQGADRKEAIKKLVGGSTKAIVQFTPLKDAGDKIGLIAEGGVDLVDWLQKQRVTKRDRELQSLMLKPIPQLTEAFIQGIVAKSGDQPVVLLLDTYEKSNNAIDNWLWQYLVANPLLKSHRVRIVVAGRKNLLQQEGWRKLQQDLNSVYSLEIDRFDETQTAEYLAASDIESTAEIYQVTKGLPYYLNWIREQQAKGKELDLSIGNREIVNLLLQGLNTTQKKLIQLAACCRYFHKSLIEHLANSHQLDFDSAVDSELNCFAWLSKLDFVEFTQNTYRLDDVARDVFRLSLWQEDEGEEFRQVNDLLANYYSEKATKEIDSNDSPPRIYENQEWQQYTAESLYHCLYARQKDWESRFLNHLFSACYLQTTDVVTVPFNAIIAEMNIEYNILFSSSVRKFLHSIKPVFDVYCLAFDEENLTNVMNTVIANDLADKLYSEQEINKLIDECGWQKEIEKLLSEINTNDSELQIENIKHHILFRFQKSAHKQIQAAIKPAREYCFSRINLLTGLAKFAGLLYQAKYCPATLQYEHLQQAKSQAEKIISDADPEFGSRLFLWDLGTAFVNLGRFDEAIASYDQALEIKSDDHQAWYNRGVSLGNLGRFDEAIASYDQALEIKPDDHQAWNNRGNALSNLSRFEQAVASYDKAIKIKPDDRQAWNNRGIALGNLGRFDEAIASYDQALEIKSDDHQAWYNRGVSLGNLGRFDQAISSYDQAIKIKPDDHQAWNNLGNALSNLGRFDQAIAFFDKAIKIKPDKDEAWNNLGNALSNLGRFDEAISSYNQAIEIKPDQDKAWYNIACCYALQNNVELTIINLTKAISLNPEYKEMAKTDPDFNLVRDNAEFKKLLN